MKINFKRTLALVMALVMSLSSVSFASEIEGTKVILDENTNKGKGSSIVNVEQEATNFDVVIPLELPVYMDEKGVTTVSNNAYIYNKSYGPIVIDNVSIEGENEWSIIGYYDDYSKVKVGSKQLGFFYKAILLIVQDI